MFDGCWTRKLHAISTRRLCGVQRGVRTLGYLVNFPILEVRVRTPIRCLCSPSAEQSATRRPRERFFTLQGSAQ
jgi:hypothetical protein